MSNIFNIDNPDDVDRGGNQPPLGQFKAMITGTKVFTEGTNANNPNPAIISFEVVDGDAKGRAFERMYNVNHVNDQARNIAKAQVLDIYDALGRDIRAGDGLDGGVVGVITGPQKKDPARIEIKKVLSESDYDQLSLNP